MQRYTCMLLGWVKFLSNKNFQLYGIHFCYLYMYTHQLHVYSYRYMRWPHSHTCTCNGKMANGLGATTNVVTPPSP